MNNNGRNDDDEFINKLFKELSKSKEGKEEPDFDPDTTTDIEKLRQHCRIQLKDLQTLGLCAGLTHMLFSLMEEGVKNEDVIFKSDSFAILMEKVATSITEQLDSLVSFKVTVHNMANADASLEDTIQRLKDRDDVECERLEFNDDEEEEEE